MTAREAVASPTGRRHFVRSMLFLSDAVMLVLSTALVTYVRFGQFRHVQAIPAETLNLQFADLSLIIALIWLASLWHENLYDLAAVFWGTGEYRRVVRALSIGIVVFVLATYLLKLPEISRAWLIGSYAAATVCVIAGRAVVREVYRWSCKRGLMSRKALIVGYNAEASGLIGRLRSDMSHGLVPAGVLASSKADQLELGEMVDGVPVIGSTGEIKQILRETLYDTVIIASTAFDSDILARVITDMRGFPVEIQLSSAMFDVATSRVRVLEVSGIPLISIKGVSFSPGRRLAKRTFDLVVTSAIVLAGMPVWLLVAAAIKLESPGPVFYRQTRIGRGGREFGMYKFRSMRSDADAVLAQLAEHNEASGPLFKMKHDPRITRVGKWLRKFSIDEFPQLINVLKGEMSLVGPRPPLPSETGQYNDYHWRRMEVPPGMTGLWQVSGRSSLTFEEMIRLDLFYIENWSVAFDLSLIARTIPAVLFARGAY
ncbi:MAG TPA: sugar transferase [Coriobacteriia bacterium]|nr:sugar transferase [Coriobacteriia bacterium]